MHLNKLITQANTAYKLGLTPSTAKELKGRLVVAGCTINVQKNHVSKTLDTILALAEDVTKTDSVGVIASTRVARSRGQSVSAAYASLKREASLSMASEGCAKCSQPTRKVKLVGDRVASYCVGCHIALPEPAE